MSFVTLQKWCSRLARSVVRASETDIRETNVLNAMIVISDPSRCPMASRFVGRRQETQQSKNDVRNNLVEARLVVSDLIVYRHRARLPPIANTMSSRVFEVRRKSVSVAEQPKSKAAQPKSKAEQPKSEAEQPSIPTWILGVVAFLAGYLIVALCWQSNQRQSASIKPGERNCGGFFCEVIT